MCIVCARGLSSGPTGTGSSLSFTPAQEGFALSGHDGFGPLSFLNADARGGTSPNGRPTLTPTAAGAQLTRANVAWNAEGAALGTASTVTFAFRSTAPATIAEGVTGFTRFSEMQINMTLQALAAWSDVANITFVRVGTGTTGDAAYSDNATMLFANHGTVTESGAAFAYLPGDRAAGSISGDVWVNIGLESNQSGTVFQYGRLTLVHEIGHAIGLDHPAEYNAGQGSPNYAQHATYYEDSYQYTLMSYFEETNTGGNFTRAGGTMTYPAAPMMDDIMAAQRLYGANMTTRTGDTVYGFDSTAGRDWFHIGSAAQTVVFTVWDAGGIDTLNFSGYSQAQTIDLRAGAFSSVGGLVGNVAIAVGATIENAIGGSGADILRGNAAANVLRGNSGSDTLDGGAGVDTAVYAGLSRGYSAISQTRVAGGREGGADTLTGIERIKFLDGTISYETGTAVWIPDEATIAVARLYQVCLGRAPDIGGLEHYRSAVDQGYDLMHFTRAMIESPEFISRFGTLTNQQFIEQVYRFVLGREGDAGGVATYVAALSQGYTRADVVLVFSESPENKLRYQTTWETVVQRLEDGRYPAGATDEDVLAKGDGALVLWGGEDAFLTLPDPKDDIIVVWDDALTPDAPDALVADDAGVIPSIIWELDGAHTLLDPESGLPPRSDWSFA